MILYYFPKIYYQLNYFVYYYHYILYLYLNRLNFLLIMFFYQIEQTKVLHDNAVNATIYQLIE